MANPTIETALTETKANLRWNLPVWLVIICVVIFSVLLGAGIFGFLINPPIVLYHSQAINTTPIHAHSALFGVYGSLAIALMLFPLREMTPESAWNEKLLNFAFWSLNGGLVAMLVASVNYGTCYAHSAEIINSPWMHWTVWLRIPRDILFSLGAAALFVFTLRTVINIFRSDKASNIFSTAFKK